MLHRPDPGGVLLLSQPAHARICGDMARAWGAAGVAPARPPAEVALAAEIHDIGWLDWEAAPTWNPATGLPHPFTGMDAAAHVDIWTRGPRLAAQLGLYVGLLVSRHGTGLFSRYRSGEPPPEIKAWFETETAWQAETIGRLSAAGWPAADLEPECLETSRRLIAAWDLLSLRLCLGATEPLPIPVPGASGEDVRLTLHHGPDAGPADRPGRRYTLDPWPFTIDRLEFRVEGRRLAAPQPDAAAMRRALEAAPLVPLVLELSPGPAC